MAAALKDAPATPFPAPTRAAPPAAPVVASATDQTDAADNEPAPRWPTDESNPYAGAPEETTGSASDENAAEPQWPAYAERPVQSYPRAYPGAYPRAWGPYAAAPAPVPARRYGPAAIAPSPGQYYAVPPTGYGFALPAAPAYPAAGWSGQPARGTGGLY
jgi:hypothetical protein